MNRYKPPYKIWYDVMTYSDKTTDLLEKVHSFTSYKKALIDYNSEIRISNGDYLVEFSFSIETNDKFKDLAFSKILRKNIGYNYE